MLKSKQRQITKWKREFDLKVKAVPYLTQILHLNVAYETGFLKVPTLKIRNLLQTQNEGRKSLRVSGALVSFHIQIYEQGI